MGREMTKQMSRLWNLKMACSWLFWRVLAAVPAPNHLLRTTIMLLIRSTWRITGWAWILMQSSRTTTSAPPSTLQNAKKTRVSTSPQPKLGLSITATTLMVKCRVWSWSVPTGYSRALSSSSIWRLSTSGQTRRPRAIESLTSQLPWIIIKINSNSNSSAMKSPTFNLNRASPRPNTATETTPIIRTTITTTTNKVLTPKSLTASKGWWRQDVAVLIRSTWSFWTLARRSNPSKTSWYRCQEGEKDATQTKLRPWQAIIPEIWMSSSGETQIVCRISHLWHSSRSRSKSTIIQSNTVRNCSTWPQVNNFSIGMLRWRLISRCALKKFVLNVPKLMKVHHHGAMSRLGTLEKWLEELANSYEEFRRS